MKIALLLLPVAAVPQTHSGFPVDIVAGPAPQAVMADGHHYFVYELHLTNFASLPIELTRIEVWGDGATRLGSYDGKTLQDMVAPVEKLSLATSPTEAKGNATLGEGHAAVIFFNLALDSAAALPHELRHRFSFSVARKDKPTFETTLEGPAVPVVGDPVPVLQHAPLRGASWIAFNALGAADHRRSLNAVDGRERIPQRFAVDWARLGPDGRMLHGTGTSNADFYSYGAEVLAVATGRITDTKDGIPDNQGTSERAARSVTLETVVGNYVVLDVGQGRYAVYAHLQPGSLKVKPGDLVKAGQPLALLGNSGNSDAPHLHFQIGDGPSPMASEGVPYELETFVQRGFVGDQEDSLLEKGHAWRPAAGDRPLTRHAEFPLNNAVVIFP